MPNTFFQIFLETVKNDPSKICFELFDKAGIDDGRAISFGQMHAQVSAAAGLLSDRGVTKGDLVLIFAQHSLGKLAAFFGAQWIGAIPAFMPPPTVKQDVSAWAKSHAQIIDRIRPRVIVCEPQSIEHVCALGVQDVISTVAIEVHEGSAINAPLPIAMDQVAFLQHSSGTTGLKKGVTVTYRQLLSQIDVYSGQIGLDRDCTVVSWLPIYHDMGLIAATLMPMRCGVSVRLIDTFTWLSNPGMLLDLLARHPASFCWLPNFAFNYMAKRARTKLGVTALADVKAVINCSEPCKIADMHAFADRFESFGLRRQAVQVCYAAAEYVFAMTQTDLHAVVEPVYVDARILEREHRAIRCSPDHADAKPIVPVGKAIAGADIQVGTGLAEGMVGELRIAGPSLCNGYFRNDEITHDKFKDGWYLTGDLGFCLNDTYFVTGRTDDLVIVRGKNIYAHDVEAVAGAVPGVKAGRVIAFGVDDASGTQALAVAVESVGDADAKDIQLQINLKINDLFGIVPADVCVVSESTLIKTTSGKISRSENRRRYLDGTLVQYQQGERDV